MAFSKHVLKLYENPKFLSQTSLYITSFSRIGSSSNHPSKSAIGIMPEVMPLDNERVDFKTISDMPTFNTFTVIKDLLLSKITNKKSQLEFDKHHAFNFWKSLKDVYGSTFRINIIGQQKIVFITRPDDIETFFRVTMNEPVRDGLLSLKAARYVAVDDFFEKKAGITTENNEEWRRVRTKVQAPVLRPKNIVKYLKEMDNVARDFTDRIDYLQQKHGEMPSNFQKELYKYALETVGAVALHRRLGCLNPNLPPDSMQVKLIQAVNQVFELMNVLEVKFPWWKYIPSPTFKRFKENHHFVLSVVHPLIVDAEKELQNKLKDRKVLPTQEQNLLETLLSTDGLTRKDVVTFILDLFMGGVDTTSHSTGFTLYLLARNKDKQKKLQEEVDSVLGDSKEAITEEKLAKLSYLKACIKESQRMFPLIPGNTRTLQKDVIIGGYKIPKGHIVFSLNLVSAKDEKNFKNSDQFIPERWMRERPLGQIHPYASLPFSTGARMCIGRRIAEQEMFVLLARIMQRFNIDYKYKDMGMTWRLVAMPSEPLRFEFTERK